MERLHVRIQGIVQGVFFRANTQNIASGLGLAGWVRNCPDGSVEIMAEGKKEKLEAFLQWCQKGPEDAHIDKVEHEWGPAQNEFSTFRIRYWEGNEDSIWK